MPVGEFWEAVAPHVGAWIEITKQIDDSGLKFVAPHVGAWIEIVLQTLVKPGNR